MVKTWTNPAKVDSSQSGKVNRVTVKSRGPSKGNKVTTDLRASLGDRAITRKVSGELL